MSLEHFGLRLMEAVKARQSQVVVGIDPDYDLLPAAGAAGTSARAL